MHSVKCIGKLIDMLLGHLIASGVVREKAINGRYTPKDILKVIIQCAMNSTFIERTAKMMRMSGRRSPDADTVFRRLKDDKRILDDLIAFNDHLLKMAKKRWRWFHRPVVVAIDLWDREYYGKRRDVSVSGGKHRNGTSYFHRIATLAVVENGKRFEIAMTPVYALDPLDKIVRSLVETALKHIKIKVLLLDRGFNSEKVIRVLDDLDLKYIMPMRKNKRVENQVKDAWNKWYHVVEGYQFSKDGDVITNLVIVNKKVYRGENADDLYLTYITNLHVEEREDDVLRICFTYEKRWGIETGYRVKKWEFRAKTCSQSSVVRFFIILLSVILYNIWTLTRYSDPSYPKGIPAYIFKMRLILILMDLDT